MLFLVKIEIQDLKELSIAIMAIHQEWPSLMFTFAPTISGERYGVPFTQYSFYTVSEMSDEYVRGYLSSQAKNILSRASIKIIG